jgi:glycosyltransferase involved in cell wall biosynthesis
VTSSVLLSVVIPVFNEGGDLRGNLSQITSNVLLASEGYEILLIDDGSSDNTWEVVKAACAADPRIKGIRFSRNYGKESAIYAGLERASGQHVLVMDSDLQHPPAVIPDMVKKYLDSGLDVLDGVKRSRGNESAVYRIAAVSFYWVFSRLSGMDLERASDFKILSRQVVDELVSLQEYSLFFRGLSSWIGFRHGIFEFDVANRKPASSKWTIGQLINLGTSAVTGYTSLPLQIVSFLGLTFLLFALILGIQTLFNKITGVAVDGFTTVILLLLVIGATIMISLGIMGQYLKKIYDEVKRRPRYIVKDEA